MAEKGFVKLNRGFFENPFWKEKRTYSNAEAWIDLIQSARFESAPEKVFSNMKMIVINRGEMRASQRFLAQRWGWSVGKVNRFINILEMEHMVERRMEHSETIIKLCKYDTYNNEVRPKMNTNRHTNSELNGTATEQRQIQTKEGKEREEGKERKEDSAFAPPALSDVISYFKEKGYTHESAVKAFDYYDSAGWKDSTGKKVKNWKQKMIAVWMKPENLIPPPTQRKRSPGLTMY